MQQTAQGRELGLVNPLAGGADEGGGRGGGLDTGFTQ